MNIILAEINPITFYPLLGICLLFALIAITLILINKFSPKHTNIAKIICGISALALFSVLIWLMTKYYIHDIKDGGYYTNVSTLWLSISALGLIILLTITLVFFTQNHKHDHTKSIVFGAVSIALAYALSYIRLFRMPQGGSITLCSLLPIMVYSYFFGSRKGVGAGLTYGFLQAITDAWIIHPVQFLLDYPIAFAFIGLTGIFKENNLLSKIPSLQIAFGGIIACALRYISHVLSGIFAFEVYAPVGFGAVSWSFLYNTFSFADMAIALVAGGVIFANKRLVKQLGRLTAVSKAFNAKYPKNTAVSAVSTVSDSDELALNSIEENTASEEPSADNGKPSDE